MADISAIDQTAAAPAQATPAAGDNVAQMKALASQFEALLLGQMMKQMRESLFSDDEDETQTSGFGSNPLAEQMYSELSVALSKNGGLGLGDALGPALAKQAAQGDALSAALQGAASPLSVGLPVPGGGDTDTPSINPVAAAGLLGPSGRVTSAYGWRQDPIEGGVKFHQGTDIARPIGHDVEAADAGRVESVGEVQGYGLTVVIRHAGGLETRYAHLSQSLVKAGDLVTWGEVIARSGSSGKSTGPHLHFEVIRDGQPVDPSGYVQF